jgi:uncharacterized protein (DUF2336 family)
MTRPHNLFDGRPGAASERQSLIDELEATLVNRDISAHANLLRRITDLFVSGPEIFSEEQQALFDDVMGRLVDKIDRSARAAFGKRLSGLPNAPPNVCRTLALDDSIEVAGPVLSLSDQLTDETLISSARTRSQEHLLAISRRRSLSEGVTDVLVERGHRPVVISTAENNGARFSQFGYSTLVSRAEADGELALKVWSRPEIPREHLLALFAAASDAVRLELMAADSKKTTLVQDMIKRASDRVQMTIRKQSPVFAAIEAEIKLMSQAGDLTEDALREFAEACRFDHVTVALSLLCNLPIGVIERIFVHDRVDQMLVLARSIGLSWITTKAVLLVWAKIKGASALEIDRYSGSFNKLKPETAQTAIRFYRLRESAARNTVTEQ